MCLLFAIDHLSPSECLKAAATVNLLLISAQEHGRVALTCVFLLPGHVSGNGFGRHCCVCNFFRDMLAVACWSLSCENGG